MGAKMHQGEGNHCKLNGPWISRRANGDSSRFEWRSRSFIELWLTPLKVVISVTRSKM